MIYCLSPISSEITSSITLFISLGISNSVSVSDSSSKFISDSLTGSFGLDSFFTLASLFLAVAINDFLISNGSVKTLELFVASHIPLYNDADFFKSLADCFRDSDLDFNVSILSELIALLYLVPDLSASTFLCSSILIKSSISFADSSNLSCIIFASYI